MFTDGRSGYEPLTSMGFNHEKVAHSDGECVRGAVSANGIENCWSLLKRCITGTRHYLSAEHLHRYPHERSFRYNYRKEHVVTRMGRAATAMRGLRPAYAQLTAAGV